MRSPYFRGVCLTAFVCQAWPQGPLQAPCDHRQALACSVNRGDLSAHHSLAGRGHCLHLWRKLTAYLGCRTGPPKTRRSGIRKERTGARGAQGDTRQEARWTVTNRSPATQVPPWFQGQPRRGSLPCPVVKGLGFRSETPLSPSLSDFSTSLVASTGRLQKRRGATKQGEPGWGRKHAAASSRALFIREQPAGRAGLAVPAAGPAAGRSASRRWSAPCRPARRTAPRCAGSPTRGSRRRRTGG